MACKAYKELSKNKAKFDQMLKRIGLSRSKEKSSWI